MASGKFQTPMCYAAGSGYSRNLYVTWSSTNDTTNNKSTITWKLYAGSEDSSTGTWVLARNIKVKINGVEVYSSGNNTIELYKNGLISQGTTSPISHNTDGTKSVPVSIEASIYWYGSINNSYNGNINLTTNPMYSLSVTAGSGTTITIERTYCAGVGSTGIITAGDKKLNKGDLLKITSKANAGYSVLSTLVNGSSYKSGSTYTVSGNTSVVTTSSQPLSTGSSSATVIGEMATIYVTRKNSAYTHTITYTLGGISGTICTKSTNEKITWTVPTTLYSQLPNSKNGSCTIKIYTYSGDTNLGSTTFMLPVIVDESTNKPTVTGVVVDTNSVTTALTGDSGVLVRYLSTATATITATAKNSATISKKSISGVGITTGNTVSFPKSSLSSYSFSATDSRGFVTSRIVAPRVINYVPISANITIKRSFSMEPPYGSKVVATISGNYFNGSFGVKDNSLKIRYCYKSNKSGEGAYGSWTNLVLNTDFIVNSGNTYNTIGEYEFPQEIDEAYSYTFKFEIIDESGTTSKTIKLEESIPIFDWGKDNFNINKELLLSRKNIKDMIHPVGSVIIVANSQIADAKALKEAIGFGNWIAIPDQASREIISGCTVYTRLPDPKT